MKKRSPHHHQTTENVPRISSSTRRKPNQHRKKNLQNFALIKHHHPIHHNHQKLPELKPSKTRIERKIPPFPSFKHSSPRNIYMYLFFPSFSSPPPSHITVHPILPTLCLKQNFSASNTNECHPPPFSSIRWQATPNLPLSLSLQAQVRPLARSCATKALFQNAAVQATRRATMDAVDQDCTRYKCV